MKVTDNLAAPLVFKVQDGTTPLGAHLSTPPSPSTPTTPPRRPQPPAPLPSSPHAAQPSRQSPASLHFAPGPMPVSPPGNWFPALVVAGHVVTLIFAWQRRVRKKQGKSSRAARRAARPQPFLFRAVYRRLFSSVVSALSCSVCLFRDAHPSLSHSLTSHPLCFPPPHTSGFPVVGRCCC